MKTFASAEMIIMTLTKSRDVISSIAHQELTLTKKFASAEMMITTLTIIPNTVILRFAHLAHTLTPRFVLALKIPTLTDVI